MRYAKALPRDFCFLPGLHGSHRTGASQPMQNDTYASRWEGCLQVSCFPLAGCVDLVHQQLSPRRRLPSSSSTRQKLWLRNIAAALIVDTITTTTSQRLVVMPEACPGGQQGTASSTGLVARLGDRRGLATTAVFGISQRLLPPTMCGNPNPDASFDRGC